MTEKPLEAILEKQNQLINQWYTKDVIQYTSFMGREFLGVISKRGISFMTEKLNLNPESHVIDLGSGLGGPARYLAKTYGCKVTGLDLSKANYEKAQEMTKEAGLDHLVDFVHGNALAIPLQDMSFTHAIDCDAWCYIPDKLMLFKEVYRVLKPNGYIAFLEGAHEAERRYVFELSMGRCFFESIEGYRSKLEEAGFEKIEYYDMTELNSQDILDRLYDRIINRNKIIEAFGEEHHHGHFERFIEILGLYSKRELTHCCYIAQKG